MRAAASAATKPMRAHGGDGTAGVPYSCYFGRFRVGRRFSASEAFPGHRGKGAEKREERCRPRRTEAAVRPD